MIELVSTTRCIGCDACIRACPRDVFERGPDRVPRIARQDDCQTCFLCEAWCPADALFVAPQTTPAPVGSRYHDEDALARDGLLGSYRRQLGWGKGQTPGAQDDQSHVVIPLLFHGPPKPADPETAPDVART